MRKGTNWQSRKNLVCFLSGHMKTTTRRAIICENDLVCQEGFSITKDMKEGQHWRKQVGLKSGSSQDPHLMQWPAAERKATASEVLPKEKGIRSHVGFPAWEPAPKGKQQWFWVSEGPPPESLWAPRPLLEGELDFSAEGHR